MLNMYQNKSIKEANSPNEATTYWFDLYLWIRFDVWYRIEPDAKMTMPTLNQRPKLKPNNIPATMRPKARAKPMAKIDFRKEKSFLVKKTIAERPVNNDKVIIAA